MRNNITRFLFTGFILLVFSVFVNAQNQHGEITSVVGKLIRVTPKLADIDPTTMYGKPLQITRDKDGIIGISDEGEEKIEEKLEAMAKHFPDGALRNLPTTLLPNTPITAINQNFDGQTWSGFDPSDNNIAVGPNHVIQIINNASGSMFKIWNKSGAVVQNGTTLTSLTGVAGLGDPIVMYDQLANRWIMSEFGPGGTTQNYLVMAVSTSADPTGTWKIYQYTDNTFFPDYPKYSVWHNAYYARSSDFNTAGTAYLGGSIYAFDRNAMLAGNATATMVRVRLTDVGTLSYYYMNTIGLDGTTPSSQSGLFAVPDGANSKISLFEFTPNFTTPSASVVGPLIPLTIASYSTPPGNVAQQGATGLIGTLGERLMYRLSYRNRAGTESILIAHTVQGATTALGAVRWYEMRKVAGAWTVYQQGTLSNPDGNSRFMPGISMDALGNIALMYNVSGTTSYPSIKYTARNECDPLGQMTLAEQTIITGTAPHAPTGFSAPYRWGDYNTLVADPTINGSFWSTAEYGGANNGGNTRIANFTVTGGAASFATQPSNIVVCAGTTAAFSVVVNGNPPLTYQWQRSNDNGVTWADITGATAATYSFTAIAADNGSQFRCNASSSCGIPGTSNAAVLTITTLSQGGTLAPATANACGGVNGNSTTMTLTGYIGNILRWEQSVNGGTTWTTIVNTNPTLTVTNITATTLYRAVVQSSGCTASNSTVSTITYLPTGIGALTITADKGTTICAGTPDLLTVLGLVITPFSNTGAIQVPATPTTSGPASPYPATIAVSGLPTTGVSVNSVTITGISHTWESDMSFLLQSPTGQNVILMSNVSGNENGGFGILNKTFTFSDAATSGLAAGVASGTYKCTNNSTTRNWPAPGPGIVVQGANPLLSTFTGNVNGTWKLYAFDAASGDFGNVSGGFSINFGQTGLVPGLSYTWSPATGLSSTVLNPVAASPNATTTYSVVATSAQGCTGSASITINVNQLPKITTQPTNLTACSGTTATFTSDGTGTAITYQWQESKDAGVTYNNITNGTVSGVTYAGATTNTLSISGITAAMNNNLYRLVLSGTCTPSANSNGAKLTIIVSPTVSVSPTSGCGGVAGTNGTLLTASGANSYTWSPIAGLYTNATTTTAYTGTNAATVYAAPTAYTTYVVTGTSSATGCSSSATAKINYTPNAPIINPSPANMCLGDGVLMLTKAQPQTLSFSSGAISVAVPDNSLAGATSNITVSGIPAGATITNIAITWNMTHTWDGDMVFALKAPNSNILNLDYYLGGTGGAGATTGFVNTTVSSNGTAALSAGTNPYTGIFAADAASSTANPPGGPTGYIPNVTNFSGLYSTPNGTYTLAMYDGGAGDLGTLTSWKIDITYQAGLPSTSPVWSPVTYLYTNASATIPYIAGTPRDTVWCKPPTTPLPGSYSYQVISQSVPPPPATATTNFASGNGNALITFNVRNNTASSITLSSIASMVFTPGSSDVTAYYNTTAINGAPGAIITANGWNPIPGAVATIPGSGSVEPFFTNLSLAIPAGATYGICVQALQGGAANIGYSTLTAGNTYIFNAPGSGDIITGDNIGWGGGVIPAVPGNTPRGFIGSIGFASTITPCTSPVGTVVVKINDSVKITKQPSATSICTNLSGAISVSATGTGLTYQWQVRTPTSTSFSNVSNGGVYSGATTASLTITSPATSMNGNQYQCIVSGISPCGGKTTNIVVLTVNNLPSVTIDASLYHNIFPGLRTTVFSTVSTPGGSYVWSLNGSVINGANASSTVVNIDGVGTYTLQFTDANGCTNTSNAVVIGDSVSNRVFVYPNPNAGQFQVRYYSATNATSIPRGINVFDARGKRILTQSYSINAPYARMNIDLSNQSTGVYWLEVTDVNGNRLAMGRVEVVR